MSRIIDQLVWCAVLVGAIAVAVALLVGCGDNAQRPFPVDCCALHPSVDAIAACAAERVLEGECSIITCQLGDNARESVVFCNYPSCSSLGCTDAALCNAYGQCSCAGEDCEMVPTCASLGCPDRPSGDPTEWTPCYEGEACWCPQGGFVRKCEVR